MEKTENIWSDLISSKCFLAYVKKNLLPYFLKFYAVKKNLTVLRATEETSVGLPGSSMAAAVSSVAMSRVEQTLSLDNLVQPFCHLIQTRADCSKDKSTVSICINETRGKRNGK